MAVLVSCIVPTFNAARYLPEALESISAQRYRPIEIVVADDGSSDETLAICSGWVDPVRVVSTDGDVGPAATRNAGLLAASGDLVAFLDPDDRWHPDKLAVQSARFNADATLDVCLSLVRMFWEDEVAHERPGDDAGPRAGDVPGFATTTMLARRQIFDRVGLLDPRRRFSDAPEWFIRASESGARLEVVERVLTFHRMHGDNLTRRSTEDSRREFLELIRSSLRQRRRDGTAVAPPYTFGTRSTPENR
ncbi:MAG: glycosyltransferase family A protein [Acidimicrobiales bacterium]